MAALDAEQLVTLLLKGRAITARHNCMALRFHHAADDMRHVEFNSDDRTVITIATNRSVIPTTRQAR